MPSTPMTERRAAVKCITRVQKEKKEATMMDLYYGRNQVYHPRIYIWHCIGNGACSTRR
jgi:hypothetical protein